MKLLATTTLVLVFAMTAFAGNPLAGDGDALMKNTPICFQENRGQIVDTDGNPRTDIAFTARVAGVQLYFRQDGISYVFSHTDEQASPQTGATHSLRKRAELAEPTPLRMQLQRMDMTLAGCNPAARIRAYDAVPGVVNYYLGHCPQGITGVREYRRIVYENIYDRIDLELLTVDGKVKYNFIVRPGGDPRAIRMRYDGAEEAAIRHDGSLVVGTALGGIEEQAPYTYCGSENNAVASRFVRDGSTLRFDVAEYDATQTLVIDPWATYYGGSREDHVNDVAVDDDGGVYITGWTLSRDFPVSTGAFDVVNDGKDHFSDAFLVKFSSSGTREWATYLGAAQYEEACAVSIDAQGAAIITGRSNSRGFPATPGPLFSKITGFDTQVFVTKFSSSGSLIWSTLFGGGDIDVGQGISVDGNGNYVICGYTASQDYPVTGGAYMSTPAPGFLTKLSATGALLWSTYAWEHINACTYDGAGGVLVTGVTANDALPSAPGVFQHVHGGGRDAFVARFTGQGAFDWLTYCGGTEDEEMPAISTDPAGNILVTGTTFSNTSFPVTSGAYQTTFGGFYVDGFIVKLNSAGAGIWASFLGGESADGSMDVQCDGTGNIIAAMRTSSTNLAVSASAVQSALRGSEDWYILKLDGSGTFLWATYYGGTGTEGGGFFSDPARLAVSTNGSVHLAGTTQSNDISTVAAFQNSFAGEYDGFLLQLNSNGGIPLPNQAPIALASASPTSGTVPFTVNFVGSNSSDPDNDPLTYYWDFGDNTTSTAADPAHVYNAPGTHNVVLTVSDGVSSSVAYLTIEATTSATGVMYIAEMYTERIPQPGNKELCSYRVRIKDGNGDPMHNVYVHFQYYGPSTGEWYGITGPNGWCGIETNKLRDPVGVWSFLVDEVYEPGYTYDSTMNCHAMPYNEPVPKSLAALPSGILLHQNYPNPFNPTTVIRFELPREMAVDLVVTDALGRDVWDAGGRRQYAGGEHAITFDAANLPSGFYHYRLETPDGVLARKMLLLR